MYVYMYMNYMYKDIACTGKGCSHKIWFQVMTDELATEESRIYATKTVCKNYNCWWSAHALCTMVESTADHV